MSGPDAADRAVAAERADDAPVDDGEPYMARALELAARGLYTTDPNPRVGCVLVRDGRMVGEGWHVRAGEPHAEVHALRAAGAAARGATAYVTLEPCSHTGRTPPCADALLAAGVSRVVAATVDPNPRVAGGGLKRLEAGGVAVEVGLRGAYARALNPGFFARFTRSRPFVRLKLAMSLDARTSGAAAPGADAASRPAPTIITDEVSRADVQTWRARSSAVLTGAGTVRSDDPRLDVRLDYGPWIRQPLRVVLDPDLTVAPTARVFKDAAALVFAASGAVGLSGVAQSADDARRIERVPRATGGGLDLRAVLGRLAQLEVNEILVECGPRLAAAFLEAALVDELILYVAPHFLGADAPPLASFCGLDGGRALPRFEYRDHQMLAKDLRLVLTPTHE